MVVTRARHQAHEFVERLREAGAVPLLLPTIAIRPPESHEELDGFLRAAHDYDWVIFTSSNGVEIALDRMGAIGLDPIEVLSSPGIATIGPSTARALEQRGVEVDRIPDVFRAEFIARALGNTKGMRILLLRADVARQALAVDLRRQGAIADDVTAYRTVLSVPRVEEIDLVRRGVDVVTFTSSSTVRGFVAALGAEASAVASSAVIASIGPVTSETARSLGMTVEIEAARYTMEGLMEALYAFYGRYPD